MNFFYETNLPIVTLSNSEWNLNKNDSEPESLKIFKSPLNQASLPSSEQIDTNFDQSDPYLPE